MTSNRPFSSNSFDTIKSKISEQTFTIAARYLPPNDETIINALNSYSLVITGTVGAGKSTVCESLLMIFKTLFPNLNIITYPEFLYVKDEDVGEKLLNNKISGDISSNTLQSYILDNWRHIMRMNKPHSGFKLFERCVDDCVICFCNLENKTNRLSDAQFMNLYEELKKIDEEFEIPTYFQTNDERRQSHFTKLYSNDLNYNLQKILSIISGDIINSISNRIIGLSIQPKTSKERILIRSRSGECGYSDDEIALYSNHYEKLFAMLDRGDRITRFVDLGTLL